MPASAGLLGFEDSPSYPRSERVLGAGKLVYEVACVAPQGELGARLVVVKIVKVGGS